MAETQLDTLGYAGEMWLKDASALYRLRRVRSFKIAGAGSREQVESTTLDSPGWRREYLSGFYEDSDFEVTLSTRALSTTDTLLQTALAAGDVRDFKQVIPENGAPVADILGTCKVIGYDRGTVEPDAPIEATVTFRVVTVANVAVHT